MKCQKDNDPLFIEELGWHDWPQGAKEKDVLKWSAELIEFFLNVTKEVIPASKVRRRLWKFDRLGEILSSPFDINKSGLQFFSATLGYLWMGEEQLGFDPTIFELKNKFQAVGKSVLF